MTDIWQNVAGQEMARPSVHRPKEYCLPKGAPEIVMVIDGHDWRYSGDGHDWLPKGHPEWSGTWADLRRRGYSEKYCLICEFRGSPDAPTRPCHEIWSDRTGLASAAA